MGEIGGLAWPLTVCGCPSPEGVICSVQIMEGQGAHRGPHSWEMQERRCEAVCEHEPHYWGPAGEAFTNWCTGRPQSIAEATDLMAEAERARRPGSQPLPQPAGGPVSHNMVIKDLLSRPVTWDMAYGKAAVIRDQVASDMLSRLELGIARYGQPLRPGNGRDMLRDCYEELLDATAYARTRMLELSEDSLEWLILARVYDDLMGHLVEVRRLRNARAATE